MSQYPNLSGYQITEELYIGTRTLVYRGIRISDQQPVVIKLLRNDYPSFNELVLFRNQYTITKNLDFSHIIKPLTLEVYHNSYALVMEDFGGVSLSIYLQIRKKISKINKTLPLAEFLQIARQLTDILNYLYQNHVIHKDIKPANILINLETKEVKLIDFSISSLLPRETQEIKNPNVLEGTLAYISPEQTGRMNRGIDYRTDFYSLGATFYELLTGELPFQANDAMELVHCHIAKASPLVHEINPQIPSVLSEVVSKLMAKNAEDRYQSALGLKFDLENCLHQLQETGKINDFPIAQRDVFDRFTLPEKLYGREQEVKILLEAFERVSIGTTEMMLVAGFSGIGKTAVVNEVHKPIVRQRGYFIKGKYDQFNRNIPFSAFVQAFRDLMGQLLSESDAQLQTWKSKILEAVGDNGQVLIDVIPELKGIIGVQPAATELSGTAAQNRFNLLMQKFLQVFTSVEHPLVIFLDDLQWADSASLKLLQLLMSETGHLLVLGAYRDNEVSPAHPFILTVDEIVKTGALVNTITLQSLSLEDMNQLVADTLNCELSQAQPLTELVYQKTKGNPFFATQFLKALYDDKLISFDWKIQHWQCDLTQVKALAFISDVVEFMALQLQKLPTQTQDALKLAACIGAQFDLQTLAIVSEQSPEITADDLWKALQEGLIIPNTEVYKFFIQSDSASVSDAAVNPTYRFLHDRVQQAAYSLIPEQQKTATHLKIGQLIQEKSSEIEQEEKLFDIVGHLNRGIELITQPREREELVQLNLKAGQKARSSTAYAAARVYLQTGIGLLEINCWQSQYELTLKLYVASAEAAYLNADLDGMEEMAAVVLQSAQTIFDKVKIYEIQIAALTARSQMLGAIAVGREALAQLGVELPTEVDEIKIGKALQDLNHQLQDREIAGLIDLPMMSDRTAIAAMQLLGVLSAPVIQGMPGLLPFLGATMVRLSLQFGNAPVSTVGYVIHGMVLCAFLGEVETGYRFGRLALSLLEKLNAQSMKSTTLVLFGTFIQHHQEALLATVPMLKDGYTAGMETGDFLFAGYNVTSCMNTALLAGVDLDTLASEFAVYSAALVQVKQDSAHIYLGITRQTVKHLREPVSQPDRLIGNAYDETVMLPKHQQDNDLMQLAVAYTYKLLLAYSWGNYQAALDYITQVKLYLMAMSGTVLVPVFHFYAALTYLALFPTQPQPEQAELLAQAGTHQTTLHQWAKNAPMNYLHKWYLVEAERQRVLGNKAGAVDLYDRAISLAKENQFLNEEALANELAAKFYLEWGKEKFAQLYAIEAYYAYSRWGAKAKVDDLEKRYSQLLAPILQQSHSSTSFKGTIAHQGTIASTRTSSSVSEVLDLATLLKASQAISGEIELNKLLITLLEIVIVNSGANKCVLLLKQDIDLKIVALIKEGESPQALPSIPLESSSELAISLVNNVKRTLLPLVLENARISSQFAADIYIQEHQPKSILCSPILNQGQLIGILYLENNLTVGAFTSDRVELLNLLCAQAAISLENARLYEQSQTYAQQLERALHDLQQTQLQMIQSEKMSALGNLVAGVAHEINNPVGFIAGNLNEAKRTVQDLTEHLALYRTQASAANITDHAEDIDLDYIIEDLPKMIDSMQLGCDRIKDISTSLCTFSRADKDYKAPFNIHSGIDSTILILKYRLKANDRRPAIEVVKDYGNIPEIECFPGQLNQVFMNILANAIDALDESNTGRSFDQIKANPNRITITTSLKYNQVKVTITDNGMGMSESVKDKIFDHLFTTKAVGKGTGLGLAIARQIIVEKHGGSLNVNSRLGAGTEFIITLPTKA
ncbi:MULTISPECIES: AAA family ATPase [unclassified Microcoleus]|uniref:AAA family ATPase n=1 Tax=unclassified Microcoleus TaxID=2642155 RepID=UPI002FD7223A